MEMKSPEKEVEYKTVFNDDGSVRFVKKSEEKKGRKSRSSGAQFEVKVRKDLEEKGWIVDKWSNNVDLDLGKIVPAKRVFKKFRANTGVMTIGTGFPDFIAIQKGEQNYRVVGVEVKVNGALDKTEKEKCKWLIENKIFNEVLVAKKVKEKNRVFVEYKNAKEIIERMRK